MNWRLISTIGSQLYSATTPVNYLQNKRAAWPRSVGHWPECLGLAPTSSGNYGLMLPWVRVNSGPTLGASPSLLSKRSDGLPNHHRTIRTNVERRSSRRDGERRSRLSGKTLASALSFITRLTGRAFASRAGVVPRQ